MELIELKTVITLYPTAAGGRKTFIRDKYSPNAVFGLNIDKLSNFWNGEFYSYHQDDIGDIKNADIRISIGESVIYPADIFQAIVKINIDAATYVFDYLNPGSKFFLREGTRLIGKGIIMSAIDQSIVPILSILHGSNRVIGKL